jgi:hypothetical protein
LNLRSGVSSLFRPIFPNAIVRGMGSFRAPCFPFPDSAEDGMHCAGYVKARIAMTGKVITLEFILPTVLAIVLGILLSMGAVYLADHYLGPFLDLLI